jgi:hypothetical protein
MKKQQSLSAKAFAKTGFAYAQKVQPRLCRMEKFFSRCTFLLVDRNSRFYRCPGEIKKIMFIERKIWKEIWELAWTSWTP